MITSDQKWEVTTCKYSITVQYIFQVFVLKYLLEYYFAILWYCFFISCKLSFKVSKIEKNTRFILLEFTAHGTPLDPGADAVLLDKLLSPPPSILEGPCPMGIQVVGLVECHVGWPTAHAFSCSCRRFWGDLPATALMLSGFLLFHHQRLSSTASWYMINCPCPIAQCITAVMQHY